MGRDTAKPLKIRLLDKKVLIKSIWPKILQKIPARKAPQYF
jgi:hypothetical protein